MKLLDNICDYFYFLYTQSWGFTMVKILSENLAWKSSSVICSTKYYKLKFSVVELLINGTEFDEISLSGDSAVDSLDLFSYHWTRYFCDSSIGDSNNI